jgi:PAS domain S-box-containing protein
MNLRLRLALVYGLLASLALTLALAAGFGFYERAAFRNVDGTLSLLARQTAAELARYGRLEPPEIGVSVTVRLFDAQGNTLEAVGNAPAIDPLTTLREGMPAHAAWVSWLPRVTPTPFNYEGLGLTTLEGERWRSYTLALEDDRLLQLLISLNNTDNVLDVVRRNFVLLGLAGVALVLIAGYFLSGASLRPLTELASNTRELLHAQNITLPAVIEGKERQSLESRRHIPSQDEIGFLSRTITSTTTYLSEERERLDLALEAAKMGWWEWDITSNTHRWSAEFERVLGLEPGTFHGGQAAFLERVHPEDRERVKTFIEASDLEARPATFEYRVVTKEGVRWIESRAQTIRDTAGRVVRILGIDLDITERKASQEELRYAAHVLASVSEAIIATDLSGHIQSWNKGATEMYGYSASEVIGKNISDVLATTFFGETRQQARDQIAHQGTWRGEVIQHHKDGTPLDVSSSVRLQYDEAGKAIGMVAANRDITERKKAERELRESEERFKAVQQTTPDGFMVFESVRDKTGEITDFRWLYANPASKNLVGRDPQTLIGKMLLVEMPGNREEGLFDAYVRVVETGQPWQREFSYQHEGINKWFRSTAAKTGDGFAVSFADITESKTLEAELRDSETFNRTVLESSPDCVKVLDLEGNIVFTNENGLCLLEFTSFAQVRGCPWWDLWPKDQKNKVKTLVEHALQGKTSHYRGYAPTAKGTPKWWDVVVSPVKGDTGVVTQVLAVSRDITEAQKLESEIRANEERYRSLVQASAQLVWSTNAQGFNTEPQQSWLTFTGQSWEEQQGWGWLNAVHPEDRERVRASWTHAVETKSMYTERERLRRADGVYRHMDVRAVPVLNSDGSVREWVGTHTDVTERVKATEALAESEERYRTLVMASNQAVFTADETGHVAGAEAVWHNLSGQLPEEAKRDGWLEAVHPDDRDRVEALWREATAGRKAYEFQYRTNARGNARRHLSVRAVPRFSSQGDFIEWIGAITDVTEQRNLELDNEFLAQMSEHLRSAEDAETLLPTISQMICKYLELPDCFFIELNEPHERYKLHAGFYSNTLFEAREEPLSLYNPVTLREGKAGRTTVVRNTAQDERFADWYEEHFKPARLEAFVNVPFLRQGELIGSFTVASDTPYQWTERELRLIQTVTERTWLTLEKLRVDQELEKQEERYRSLIEASSTIVWTTNAQGLLETEQPQWAAYTGQSFAEYKGLNWLDAVHPEDRTPTLNAWNRSLANKSLYEIEHRLRRFDGEYLWFSVRGAPVLTPTGEVREWIGTHTDISERKATEQLLADQAKTLRKQADLLALANEALIIRDAKSVITAWNEAATELYGYTAQEAVGRESHELLHTRFLNSTQETVEQTLLSQGYWEGELQHTRNDGSKIIVLSRQALRRDDAGMPLEIIEINWDITSRKQVEIEREKLLELSQRAEREALALAEIASSFSLSKPFETSLTMIAQRVALTVGADACAVEVYNADKTDLGLTGAYGYPEGFAEALSEIRVNKVETISQTAIRQGEVVIIKDYLKAILNDPNYAPTHDLVRRETWGTVVAVPMPVTSYGGGAVVVFYPKGLDPDLTDLLQLSTIVSQIALVVENARLFEDAQGKAALEERQRLARDLHDSVSQALYGISLGANSAKTALSLDSSAAKLRELERSLDYLIYMADTAMAEMKSLIFELRPESLQTEGLVVALRKHLRALELRHRFGLVLELPSEPNVSLKVKEMLYRITQEAMNNIVKHAQAKQVWITLRIENGLLQLEVRDDGLGFDTQRDFPGHLGLRSMRERAESVGAHYEILSEPNRGTTVRVTLALD